MDTFLKYAQPIKSVKTLYQAFRDAFHKSKDEEIKFPIYQSVVKPVSPSYFPYNQEIQPLKLILQIQRNPNSVTTLIHQSRLLRASNVSIIRYIVTINAPTISMSSLRSLLLVIPTWDTNLRNKNDKLVIKVRDVTNFYFQSTPYKQLII